MAAPGPFQCQACATVTAYYFVRLRRLLIERTLVNVHCASPSRQSQSVHAENSVAPITCNKFQDGEERHF